MPSKKATISKLSSTYKNKFVFPFIMRYAFVTGVVVLTVFATAVGFIAYHQKMLMLEAEAWVVHTYQVMEHIDLYVDAAHKMSAGQRGYFLTGDAGFRELYESALRDAPVEVSLENSAAHPYSITQELRLLRIMTAHNPRQQDNLVRLDNANQNLLAYMSATIEAYDKGGAQALTGDVAVLRGKTLMDAIRSIIGDMRAEEARILTKRVFVDAQANKQNWDLFTGIIVIFYLSMLTVLRLLGRTMARLKESNLVVQQSEKRHRILVEGVQDYAIYWLDPDGNVASWNAGAERFKGYKAGEIIGKNFSEFYPEDDRAKGVPQHNLQIAEAEGKFLGEGWRKRKDGSCFWASVSITPLRGDRGNLLGFAKITRDMTAQRAAEEAQAELLAIIEQSPDFICIHDLQGNLLYHNNGALPLLGLPPHYDLSKVRISQLQPQWAADLVLKQGVPTAFKKGVWYGENALLHHVTGEEIPVSQMLMLVRDSAGKPRCLATIIRDIGERKKAEKALIESNNLKNAILAGASYMIIATDVDGKITLFNDEAEKELGYGASEVLGKQTPALWHDPDDVLKRAEELSDELGQRIEPGFDVLTIKPRLEGLEKREWTFIRKNGSRVPVSLCMTVLAAKEGAITGFLGFAENIAERKKAERMKDEFTATVSHELRTPLTSIRGALGLITGGVAGVLPPKAADLTRIAHQSCERLIHIINDILDIEKLQSGKMQMALRPVEVRTLLKDALEANQAYGEKYSVRFVLKGEPPAVNILADADRLMQVFANLLSNAAKFSPAGSEVHVYSDVRGNGKVRFYVQDFGSGIPVAFRSRIFEKFAQAEDANVRTREGTGLGLAIVKNYVEAMKGSLYFSTETDVGTIFFFDLPVADDAKLKSLEAPQKPAMEQAAVLICADESGVTQSLEVIVKKMGLDYEAAPSLTTARQKLKERHFSAIVLDLMIEQGSGIAFLRALKSAPEIKIPPVVVVSGNIDEDKNFLNWDAGGIVGWLGKPIDDARLMNSLRRAISGKSRPRILHVEDDIVLKQVIEGALHEEADVVMAGTLREAREQLERGEFQLVIVDPGLPDGCGVELLRDLAAMPGRPVPILILSSTEVEVDRNLQEHVAAALVKSRVSESKITDTILALVHQIAA